ncbi:MAG: PAS domain S-box protein [Cyanobacteriota bacterium]|nr:PAS domain S-box protein [Cyanobacteriota bacterium]
MLIPEVSELFALHSILLASFMPHGACYLWKPSLVALHAISDGSIAIAYFAIPLVLVDFAHKFDYLAYCWIFLLFSAFIISCGTAHLMEIWTLWYPNYWLLGAIKAVTAALSLYTVLKLAIHMETIHLSLNDEIAQRQKIETALLDSETRYRSIVEDRTELIVCWLPDGTLAFVNEAFCRYFGLERENVIGRGYQPHIVPDDQENIDRCISNLSPSNPVGVVEHRVLVRGETRWVQWNNRGIFNAKGDLIEIQGVGRDVSDRVLAEQALQERECILCSFYDSAPMMMGVVELLDDDIIHISDNAAAAHFFGTTPEAMKYKRTSEMGVSQETLDNLLSRYRESQSTNQPVYFEQLHQTPQEIKHFSIVVSPLLEMADSNRQFSYIIEDITERKNAERNIQVSLQEKEILLKEIHHRVKNNLQVICSLLNLQMRSIKNQTVLSKFQDSQNRIRTMALIHEKLYQSQNFSKISFSEYIRDLIDNLFQTYIVKASNVKLIFELNDCFFLDIDTAIPCGLIVNELISNSLKYAFPGNKKGKIRIQTHSNEENNLVLAIGDNGKGIPPEIDPLTANSLGLKLVRNLTNQLRGELEIKRDCGTHFKLTLTRIKLAVEV